MLSFLGKKVYPAVYDTMMFKMPCLLPLPSYYFKKNTRPFSQVVLAIFFSIVFLFFSACSTVVPPETDSVASISIFPVSLRVTAINQTFSINISARDASNNAIAAFNGVAWSSSNTAVATVDAFGKITALAAGTVSIMATYEDLVDTSTVVIDETADVVDGTARYEDRLYNAVQFTGYEFNAIRYATVELLDENSGVLNTVATDANGSFNLGNVIPDIYTVRLIASVASAPASGFSVKDMSGAIYSVSQSSMTNTLNHALDLKRPSPLAGVFNLLDVAVFSAEYSAQILNLEPTDLAIYWERSARQVNTYYCTGYDNGDCNNGKGIYILGGWSAPGAYLVDTDEFDDDVILHEFGHFLTSTYSVDSSPGGRHIITQNDSDLRLSWSEGWGIFFPTAVKYWLQQSNPAPLSVLVNSQYAGAEYYIDTIGNVVGLSHNIAQGEEGDGFYYASGEAAVGRILWNILITPSFGMPKIWDVLENYFPMNASPVGAAPTSLPLFWDGLLASDLYMSSELAEFEAIFSERRVFYQADASESDNTFFTAASQAVGMIPAVTNTLYSDTLIDDVDYFSFDAEQGQAYAVSTMDLYNGTDTFIRLYEPDGTLVAYNDDASTLLHTFIDKELGYITRVRNSPTAMASLVNFTAGNTGQYIVEVRDANKSSSEYDFVGRYGTYKLIITLQ